MPHGAWAGFFYSYLKIYAPWVVKRLKIYPQKIFTPMGRES